jgi:hypothetical protein
VKKDLDRALVANKANSYQAEVAPKQSALAKPGFYQFLLNRKPTYRESPSTETFQPLYGRVKM